MRENESPRRVYIRVFFINKERVKIKIHAMCVYKLFFTN